VITLRLPCIEDSADATAAVRAAAAAGRESAWAPLSSGPGRLHPFAADGSSVRAAFDQIRDRLAAASLHTLAAAAAAAAAAAPADSARWAHSGAESGRHNGDGKLLSILLVDCLVDR
jgi:hypothetical protein